MSFVAKLQRARDVLEQQGRLSVRALGRELGLGGEELDELIEELVDVQRVAVREGTVLVCVPLKEVESRQSRARRAGTLDSQLSTLDFPTLPAPTLPSTSPTKSCNPSRPSKASASRSPYSWPT